MSALLIAVLCIGFISCSDDDDKVKSLVVGVWHYKSATAWQYPLGFPEKVEVEDDPEGEKDEWKATIVFKEDGTGELRKQNEESPHLFVWIMANDTVLIDDLPNVPVEDNRYAIRMLTTSSLSFEGAMDYTDPEDSKQYRRGFEWRFKR
ncbi:hypothetical protein D0T60_02425 [Bacteroides sp. 224]|nr:hypothetical protein [Bacteroides sp. 224]